MEIPSDPPDLGTSGRDRIAAALRGTVGAMPVFGPALVELINEVIPNQRLERIEVYLRYLAERLGTIEQTELKASLREPESIDLFEDGAYQAARALSDERRRQLAACVAEGIADRHRDYLQSKRVLRLLAELDDAEVIQLASYLQKNQDNHYWTRHANVLDVPPAYIGSEQEEADRQTAHEAGKLHLLRLGLLEERDVSWEGKGRIELSPLGRLVLRRIGLAGEDDF